MTWPNINTDVRVDSDARQFFYDDSTQLLGEYATKGMASQETVWFNGQPVATVRANVLYYINADHLSTPRSIVRASDNLEVWRWDSDPFGTSNPTLITAVYFPYNLRFPGQYKDTETGLHYNGMRDYDPRTGRYLQADPIGLSGGSNRYGYVKGNPLSLSDRRGLNTDGIDTGPACSCGDIASTASSLSGSTAWSAASIPGLRNSCNRAVYDVLQNAGADAPDRYGIPFMSFPLGAGDGGWGDSSSSLFGWSQTSTPQAGDVAAAGGHVGILVNGPNGSLGSMSQSSITDTWTYSNWPFRTNVSGAVYWRCTCSR